MGYDFPTATEHQLARIGDALEAIVDVLKHEDVQVAREPIGFVVVDKDSDIRLGAKSRFEAQELLDSYVEDPTEEWGPYRLAAIYDLPEG